METAAAEKPGYLPDNFWNTDTGEADFGAFRSEFDTLSEFKAAQDERIASLPKEADGYEVGLPEGFEIPEGTDYEFNPDDPRVGPLKEWAAANQVSQAALNDLIGLHAGHDIEGVKETTAFAQAEMAKLGDNPQARINTVKEVVSSLLPKANAEAVMAGATTYEAVVGLELMASRMRGASTAPQPKNSRQMETFAGMTTTEKLNNLPGRG